MRTTTLLVLTLSSVTAFAAEEPPYIEKYMGNIVSCKPSCYEREPAATWTNADFKRGCGFKYWSFQQQQQKPGKWGPLQLRAMGAANPDAVECKAMPKDSTGKWADTVKAARGVFKAHQ